MNTLIVFVGKILDTRFDFVGTLLDKTFFVEAFPELFASVETTHSRQNPIKIKCRENSWQIVFVSSRLFPEAGKKFRFCREKSRHNLFVCRDLSRQIIFCREFNWIICFYQEKFRHKIFFVGIFLDKMWNKYIYIKTLCSYVSGKISTKRGCCRGYSRQNIIC